MTQVNEDPAGLNYATTYSYDALGNLTSVTENGGRARAYAYDALSRLNTETNPESGTTAYKYDSDSNCASPNSSAGDLISRTDARNIRTCLQYDALHRLTQKNYSDGTTPTATYNYDQTAPWGWSLGNPIGRLTTESTSNSSGTLTANLYSYDPLGRVIVREQCQPLNCAANSQVVDPAYDLAGNMTSLRTVQSGVLDFTISYAYDSASRPTTVTSNYADSQHPATLFTADSTYGYFPHAALRKAALGNGLTMTNVFNSNLQPCLIDVNNNGTMLQTCNDSTPSGNVLDFWMAYNAGSSNNGDVANWNATGNQSFVRTFGYDSLNRLSTLNQSSGSATGCSSTYSLSWNYDAWGNRTDQNVTGGTCNAFHATTNSQNQLSGSPYQYDAAGNMTHDASHSYSYDAENRLISVDGGSTASYIYDAEGHRVQGTVSGGWTDYMLDLNGKVVAETNVSGWMRGYVYLGGQVLAEYANSTTYFAHKDHLGSTRLLTGLNQSVVQNLDYLPYGELNSSDSGTTNHKFTGDERDSESNLDHTWFRQYSSSLGRWMTPDPSGLAAVNLSNPQSLNRYAYVLNNPLAFRDPYGLYCAYYSDDGTAIESIDNNSSTGECGATGGSWVDEPSPPDTVVLVTAAPDVIDTGMASIPSTLSAEYLSNAGLLFIASCEGFRATPYNDSNGHCTVGYGHLLHRGACTAADLQNGGMNRQTALNQFGTDLATAEAAVRDNVTVPLTQEQFDALVDFAYNLGATRFQNSDLVNYLNNGQTNQAAAEFQQWGRGGPGIPARRANETAIFNGNGYPTACYQ